MSDNFGSVVHFNNSRWLRQQPRASVIRKYRLCSQKPLWETGKPNKCGNQCEWQVKTTILAKKKIVTAEKLGEVDPQFDHVMSCDIELRFNIDATRSSYASRSRVADRSRCRMISHDRTADQSHEYLGCNNILARVVNLCHTSLESLRIGKTELFRDENGAFVNTSWDRSTRHRAHPKRNALGGKILAGTFLSHMAGRSLPFHSPVRFLFVSFPSHGKSADLCSASWAWLRPWLSTPGSVSIWSAAVFTGPVSLTAQPSAPSWRSTDDQEGREACRSRSCSWLFTGARQRLAVDVFPRSGGFRGVADFVHGKMDRNACVKLRSLSTHSSICFYFAVAFLHSGQPGFQLFLVRSSFFVW